MSAASDSSTPDRPLALSRLLGAVVSVVVVLVLAQSLGITSLVMALFGGPAGLVGVAVVFALAWAAVAVVLKLFTGRAHIVVSGAAVTATALCVGAAIVGYGIPVMWVPFPGGGIDIAYAVIAAGVAVWVGIALWIWKRRGSGWSRAVGILLPVAVIGTLAVGGMQERAAADAERDSVAQAQREANFAHFLDAGVHPRTVDLAGATVVSITTSGGPGVTSVVTAGGGLATVTVDRAPTEQDDAAPCLWLVLPEDGYASGGTLDDYAAFCTRVEDRWERPDGTGVVVIDGDQIVAVVSRADLVQAVTEAARGADAAEVGAVLAALRPMSDAELREALAEEWFLD